MFVLLFETIKACSRNVVRLSVDPTNGRLKDVRMIVKGWKCERTKCVAAVAQAEDAVPNRDVALSSSSNTTGVICSPDALTISNPRTILTFGSAKLSIIVS